MPTKKYTLEELIAQCDPTFPISKEQSEWLDADEKLELYQCLLLSDDEYIKQIAAQCEADMDKALSTFFTLFDAYSEQNNKDKE